MNKREDLQNENELLKQRISDQAQEIDELKRQLNTLRKLTFGQKSEKIEYLADGQLSLFNDAEIEENRKERNEEKAVIVAAHSRKSKRTHDELAKDLPVEEMIHTIPGNERQCDKCKSELIAVGKELVRDELVYVPAKLFVRKHYAEVLKCNKCGEKEDSNDIEKQQFKKAGVPSPMIPHSFCSSELLAHIAYEKYVMGTPLYRLEKDFAAKDIVLSRATMANWILYASKEWLMPLYDLMKEELLRHSVIHADETVVQVLNEPGKKAKTDSRMWVYCAGEIDCKDTILFEYQPTRSGDHASKFLGDYSGYLVTDGYGGYDKLSKVKHCGCWAHLRRKFVEALPQDKELAKGSSAAKAIDYIDKLFAVERSYKTEQDRQKQRNEKSKEIISEFYEWLGLLNPVGSALPKAVGYAFSQKKKLITYLEEPKAPMSNNRAENAIRPFCVGRKNWLFSASVKGAEASAIFYSLAATASANNLSVEQYFTLVFSSLSKLKSNKDALLALLPYNRDI